MEIDSRTERVREQKNEAYGDADEEDDETRGGAIVDGWNRGEGAVAASMGGRFCVEREVDGMWLLRSEDVY